MNKLYPDISLLATVVPHGHGSRVIALLRKEGVRGGTVLIARGCYHRGLLEFFCLTESHKELVISILPTTLLDHAVEVIEEKMALKKAGTGICFAYPLAGFSRKYPDIPNTHVKEAKTIKENTTMYQAIITIVDKGLGEAVTNTAEEHGARGGTIINARGSGVSSSVKFFNMDIEPEKEMVIIIINANETEKVVDAIIEEHQLDQPNKGVLFVQDLSHVRGIRES